MNNITELKSTLEVINRRLNDTEEQISELEDRVSGNHCHWKEKIKNEKKSEQFERPLRQYHMH